MNKRKIKIGLLSATLILILAGCGRSEPKEQRYQRFARENLNSLQVQFDVLLQNSIENDMIPKAADPKGGATWCNPRWDWVEGFFPGMCWQLYQVKEEQKYEDAARYFQAKLIDHRFYKKSHDLGFVFCSSYGRGYKLTGEDSMRNVLIEAGKSLAGRFNPKVGSLQSWNVKNISHKNWMSTRGWEFPVIVDNMMNLQLLFELTRFTNDSTYYQMACSHADRTMKDHFRKDYSSYHVVDYDAETGSIRSKQTAQGFAHESAWTRGQAWGLYGYTMCYRYTKDEKYLRHADCIAGYIVDNLPEDYIPYWDFEAPTMPNMQKDASAAAIIASALIELNSYSENNYIETAFNMLRELSGDEYRNEDGENYGYILDHSVGSIPHNSEVDVPIIYADYYYIEALMRLKSYGMRPKSKESN